LFLTPYFESVFARRSNYAELVLCGSNAPYYRWLAELSSEFDAPLIDLRYCEELSTRAEYFYDAKHLNGPGSEALGALMAQFFGGARPLPAAWSGAPSRAEREAMLGRVEPTSIPRCVRGAQGVIDLYASFSIERPGTYQVVLEEQEARAHPGAYFVRFGGEFYQAWSAPPGAGRWTVAATVALAAGEQTLELHTHTAQSIDWDAFRIVPAQVLGGD
jgi:hypothetical protein